MTKKFLTYLKAVAIFSLIASSSGCNDSKTSERPTPDEVMNKISNRTTLEVADYETILDYLDDFIEDGENSDGSSEAGAELGKSYPYFIYFAFSLDDAPAEVQESEQYKDVALRFKKLMNK